MTVDRNLIGKKSQPQTFKVSLEAVRRFIEAVGDSHFQQDEPAIHYAPPTFPTSFTIQIPGLELDGSKMQLLHREQEYSYSRRLRIGEQVTCVAQVADVRERTIRGDHMTFVILVTTGVDNEQQPIYSARSTLVIREQLQ
jgi:N-terminal half of MaoC dehydratase